MTIYSYIIMTRRKVKRVGVVDLLIKQLLWYTNPEADSCRLVALKTGQGILLGAGLRGGWSWITRNAIKGHLPGVLIPQQPRKPDGLMLLPQGQEEWKRSGSSPGVQGWYERLQGKRTVTLHCPQLQKSRPPKTPIPLGGGKRHEGKEKRDYKTRRRRNKGKKRLHWKNPKLRVGWKAPQPNPRA